MKKFRLGTVERLRHQALDARAQELHTVGAEKNRVRTERNSLASLLAGGVGYSTSTLFSGSELELANNYRALLRQEISDRDERIAELDEEIERAKEAWLEARGKLRAVQALHDRHREAVSAERARLDQRELDEHAMNMRPNRYQRTGDTEVDIDVRGTVQHG